MADETDQANQMITALNPTQASDSRWFSSRLFGWWWLGQAGVPACPSVRLLARSLFRCAPACKSASDLSLSRLVLA